MKDKLNELSKNLNANISFFEKRDVWGVVEYLQEIRDILDLAIDELGEYCDDNSEE